MKSSHASWLVRALVSSSVALAVAGGIFGGLELRARAGGPSLPLSNGQSALLAPVEAAHEARPRAEEFTTNVPATTPFSTTNASVGTHFEDELPLPMNGPCPGDMVNIEDRYCIDRYEASLVEVLPNGDEQAWPYFMPVEGHVVRAVSHKGVYPQGYISETQAKTACQLSGKRLCKPAEWKKACRGPSPKKFGYGDTRTPGVCNDNGRSPMGQYYRAEIAAGKAWTWDKMNDPKLNQLEGTLAETGSHEGCTNGYGVHDMVGNIHEWVDDPKGTFQGGYYQDVTLNGDGCSYRTDAHEAAYHDYSTGFRCCGDVEL